MSCPSTRHLFILSLAFIPAKINTLYLYLWVSLLGLFISLIAHSQPAIDRQAVVGRHHVHINEVDTLNPLTLGNGRFAMTMDVTGLQTFPDHYHQGIPLGTMSEWGWHSFPSDEQYRIEETLQPLASHGRTVPYARQWPADSRAGQAANYLRQNPHRIHLATVGWYVQKKDGSPVTIADIKNVDQTLDVWSGELISRFEIEGIPVEVISFVSQRDDQLSVKVNSTLLKEGRLGLNINFPYPTDQFLDEAVLFDPDEPGRLTIARRDSMRVSIQRDLDSTRYFTQYASSATVSAQATAHGFRLRPTTKLATWTFTCTFAPTDKPRSESSFEGIQQQARADFHQFWNTGGMIDFGATDDPRAAELERRMILSLYLTKVNCGGSSPPQETGLTYNSWYGKPHMEMLWWHGVHFALWGRPEVLGKQLDWYVRSMKVAQEIAQRQGFKGVRWQKMTDNEGGETASSVGSYLIWQQPHPIYFAELMYRANEGETMLAKYYPIVEQTAEFMADFAGYDTKKKQYVLGPGVIPAQERFDPATTFNPTYELAYWRWALETAQQWRERLGKERDKHWDTVLHGLSPLPQQEGLYLATGSAPDSYTTEKYMTDHPSVLGTYGMLPATPGLDKQVMQRTFDKIWTDWQWHDTWGWDFPMTAMTATRLGDPEKAVDALLMPIVTNTYLKNGHNYQTKRLRLYLPGNGGSLTALAMMAAGTDETNTSHPGFPEDWVVVSEGLHPMP